MQIYAWRIPGCAPDHFLSNGGLFTLATVTHRKLRWRSVVIEKVLGESVFLVRL